MVDLIYAVRGEAVPADYHALLDAALRAALPWLEEEPLAGVHGLRTSPARDQIALLPRRARLTLRLPEKCVVDARVLENRTLCLRDATLGLSAMRVKPLVAADTIYADMVTLGASDEVEFSDLLQQALYALDVRAWHICGRQRALLTHDGPAIGYPVVLHDLKPAASLHVQRLGIGPGRRLGCGLFVPHKTITGLD